MLLGKWEGGEGERRRGMREEKCRVNTEKGRETERERAERQQYEIFTTGSSSSSSEGLLLR